MSIPVLNELYDELKRLTVAGSSLACDDFGLKKLMPRLKKLGEASPVFLKLYTKTEELVSTVENSEDNLLELLTLASAILYTQGEWEINGDIKELEVIPNDGTATLGYRKLSGIIEALTMKGQGRYNTICEAYNEGVFHKKDKRLIYPILNGLEDPYTELTDFIIQNIIPVYGKMMLPMLKNDFKIDGNNGDGKRLRAIYVLCGKEEMELYKLAASEGSVNVKLSAIEILNNEKAPEDIFLELAKDKRKEIREAAEAVLESRKTGILDKFIKVFKSH